MTRHKPSMENKEQNLKRREIDSTIYLIIAASTLAYNLTLVTNNTKHFEKILGLKIDNWV